MPLDWNSWIPGLLMNTVPDRLRLEHEELTGKIIGAAIEVHQQLGPGFLDSIYENALVYELRKRGLKVEQAV